MLYQRYIIPVTILKASVLQGTQRCHTYQIEHREHKMNTFVTNINIHLELQITHDKKLYILNKFHLNY